LNKYIKCNFKDQRRGMTPIWLVRRQRFNGVDCLVIFPQLCQPYMKTIEPSHLRFTPTCSDPRDTSYIAQESYGVYEL